MIFLFWTFLFFVFFCYFGYPLSLILAEKIWARPIKKADVFPTVTVIMAVCNEEDVIEKRICDFLSWQYPEEKLEFLVGSDGSTDKTNELIRKNSHNRIKLFEFSERRGKAATLNDLIKIATHEILLFVDARQRFAPEALAQLVKNFNDPQVGCVSGELVFLDKEGGTAKGVSLYWRYEKFMRNKESSIHSMLGATGAIYASRRKLVDFCPNDIILDDMYIPLRIIKKGYRAIFEKSSKAYDYVSDNPQEEHCRKARTLYGNYQLFSYLPYMFIPFKSPIAIQLFCHKFLRLIVPFLLMGIFLINFFLLANIVCRVIFILQLTFYTAAICGALARDKKYGMLRLISKIGYVPYVFCLLNYSAIIGLVRFISSKQEIAWHKARSKV